MSITANFESRCYGFVEFTSIDAAKKAVEAMDGKAIDAEGEASEDAAPSSDTQQLPLSVTNFESKRQRTKQGQE